MGKRVEIMMAQSGGIAQLNAGAGSQYLVQTPTGVLYLIYNDSLQDATFKKSIDGGLTWSNPTTIFAGGLTQLSIWYDRWSGIAAGLIHCAYSDSTTSDITYRTIDTENSDALSTQTVVFAGVSVVTAGSSISLSRSRGGNVYCRVCIDAGAEGGFFRLPNANVPNGAWDAARTINEALATLDKCILVPGFAADNQDMILIFWDASANEISRQLYDDSANTWAETSISGSMTSVAATSGYPQFSATVDLTNSRIILVAWNGVDTANADLLGWTVTESTITAFTTSVVLNGTDDQGLCGITLDLQTNYWWVFYGGKSDGSETYSTSINIYYKVSKDDGATWGAETLATAAANSILGLYVIPRVYLGSPPVYLMLNTTLMVNVTYRLNVDLAVPQAKYKLGI